MAAVLESPKVQSSYVYIGLDTIAKQDGGVIGMSKGPKVICVYRFRHYCETRWRPQYKVQRSYVSVGIHNIAKQDGGDFGMSKVTKGVSLGFDTIAKEDGGVFGMSNCVIFFLRIQPSPVILP